FILMPVFIVLTATATTDIYSLSLHDALPIWLAGNPVSTRSLVSFWLNQGSFSCWGEMLTARKIDGSQPLAISMASRMTRSDNSPDRKSTRLNSSHVKISYAVFCLKKKK